MEAVIREASGGCPIGILAVLGVVLVHGTVPAAAGAATPVLPGAQPRAAGAWSGEVPVSGPVTVPEGATLWIAPGTSVHARDADARILVEGELVVRGTPTRPAAIRVPLALEGGDAEAEVSFAILRTPEGPAIRVGPEASLELVGSLVEGGSAGVVVQAVPGEETPHRDVVVEHTVLRDHAGGQGPEAGAGLRLETTGPADGGDGRDFHGIIQARENRFRDNDVGLAVEGWDARGLLFEDNSFNGNELGVRVEDAHLVLHRPAFRDNGVDARVANDDGTLRLEGEGLDAVDLRVAEGASAQAGETVVPDRPRHPIEKFAAAAATLLVLLYNVLERLARALLARLLYRKEDKELLEHEARQQILEAVKEEPGVHLRELARRVGGYRRALYHVDVLEDANIVTPRRDGGYLRFYPADAEDPDRPQSTRANLLELVREAPGIEQTQAARKLDCSNQLASYHARKLERDGEIEREWSLGRKRLYPRDG